MQKSFFDTYELKISDPVKTPFLREDGIYQDGTAPMYRDTDGTLWAMSGHTHAGHIAVFKGSCLDDLKKQYPIQTVFLTGNANGAYNGVRYPEGILPRGSIWPFGLYICPDTHRFFCWFHNETGWAGDGTAYDAFGPCEKPYLDSDFRHVGLMHSDDEGKTWDFDRWVLTGAEVAFTHRYNPCAGKVLGQSGDLCRLGSGDFSLFVEPEGEYIYLFYNIITIDLSKDTIQQAWQDCSVYVARCRKRTDGVMGDFVKYYNGAFCEAGNLGRETPIVRDAWHPRVVYSQPLKRYIMTSKPIVSALKGAFPELDSSCRVMQICTSADMLDWSAPETVKKDGAPWGNHYNAIVPNDTVAPPNILTGNQFSILCNHNATDVLRYKAEIVEK